MPLTTVQSGMMDSIAQYNSFKNRIINGNMGIWQRGTTGTAAGYAYPSVDRWAGGPFSLYQVLSRNTSVPDSGFQYSLKVQRTASQTNTGAIIAMQTIESSNCYDLSGQTVTVSFWAKAGANFSAAGSSLGIQLNTGTTADQGGSTYYAWAGTATPISLYQTITTTWTKYTFTGTFGAGVLEAALVFFYTPVGTAGADDSFFITGVQLEKGSTATAFDYRPYGTELQLCQRYYLKSYDTTVVPGTASQVNGCLIYKVSSNTVPINEPFGSVIFPVTMRASPTVTPYGFQGGSGRVSNYSGTDLAAASGNIIYNGTNGFSIRNGAGATLTTTLNSILFHFTSDIEL